MTGSLWPMMMPLAEADDDSICVVGAEGHRVRYADGNEVLCGTSGLWNANLGYGNEAVARAVAEALRTHSYAGVFRYENGPARKAAGELLAAHPHDFARVVFSVSGGSANDLVMKLARQYHELGGEGGRKLVVGLKDGYHGLTFGAHALTGEDLGQRAYGVDTRLVRHLPANDEAALDKLFATLGRQIAAVVVEPVLGNGAVELSASFLARLGTLAEESGALLVADEVATGFGRTGEMFASGTWGRPPDVVLVSKGLTNGTMAASALLVNSRIADRFSSTGALLLHGETQGGTAVTAAAVSATLAEFERLKAVESGRAVAAALDTALADWQRTDARVRGFRGRGCFRAVELADPREPGAPLDPRQVPALIRHIRRAGAAVHGGPHGIQLIPALTYSAAEVGELLAAVRAGVDAHTGAAAA
ncbi:aminotransferase [Streptomyces albus]|uniref:Aminotransferase n=1 Tax=Streptomyces albus (strain ATCC 21838 / DSM 41398 / FERM P-419 / JCM 4703 / NBRC 107858) TaxID=1081613 RepID=A0A0B5F208_STRA4|nr:aminotransferase [Streptomyces albus]AOU78641.1 aminotransferase [Streptomyces albus]AYN34382.1 aspartate aminotransferase family protein [Streptomyces albus]